VAPASLVVGNTSQSWDWADTSGKPQSQRAATVANHRIALTISGLWIEIKRFERSAWGVVADRHPRPFSVRTARRGPLFRLPRVEARRPPSTAPRLPHPCEIDAPPRDTAQGAAGRRFVREQLAVARTVIVNTHKYDIHRRYVAHVFYAFHKQGIERAFLKGRYLNQELIDKGFAKPV